MSGHKHMRLAQAHALIYAEVRYWYPQSYALALTYSTVLHDIVIVFSVGCLVRSVPISVSCCCHFNSGSSCVNESAVLVLLSNYI